MSVTHINSGLRYEQSIEGIIADPIIGNKVSKLCWKYKFNKYYVFIDLKNAYDKVIHTNLFEKLKNYGIDNKLINTIKLIYSDSKLKISCKSEIINVNNGVLQGSLISPLLFNIYKWFNNKIKWKFIWSISICRWFSKNSTRMKFIK